MATLCDLVLEVLFSPAINYQLSAQLPLRG